jgi:DNA-binding transcriptional ArsR family regulator
MPATARFPLEVVVTPRFDLFYALHALASEGTTPVDSWKAKAAERLPRDFHQLARRAAPVPIFWPLLADALQGAPGALSFDQIFTTLRSTPVNDLRASVVSGIFHHRPTVDALLSRKKSLSEVLRDGNHPDRELLSHFGLRPYVADSPAAAALSALISETAAYRDALILVLQKFVQSGFGSDWSAMEPSLQAEAARLKRRAKEISIAELARDLRLPVTFDNDSESMTTRSGTVVKRGQIRDCYLIPSVFNTKRWWAKYSGADGGVTLYFPVLIGNAAQALGSPDPERPAVSRTKVNAEAVFRALGDTTRYAIASILARNPTSSAELSRSLQVSKPTITHHVQALRAAGLIRETTEGGSSRLSLNREVLAGLSAAAIEDLFSSTGKLPLSTTRQRRPS